MHFETEEKTLHNIKTDSPRISYLKNIVVKKAIYFIGQRSACVTLFLNSMGNVTFWDKTGIMSQNFEQSVLSKYLTSCAKMLFVSV